MALADHYRRDAVMTARPDQLVTMLYDRLLQAMDKARQAIVSGTDAAVVHDELVLGQRILEELRVTLDLARGGELAENLSQLYSFCGDELVAANVGKDATRIDGAEAVIRDIRDAWVEASRQVHASS